MDNVTSSSPPATSRSVSPLRPIDWLKGAWSIFTGAPGIWVAYALIFIVGTIVLAMIPLLGQLAVPLLMPVLFGGWLLTIRKQQDGGTPAIGDLFAGFDTCLVPLLIIGGITLGVTVVATVIGGVIGIGAVAGGVASGAADSGAGVAAALGVGVIAFVLMFAVGVLMSMAVWFAPALVVFEQRAPLDAIKASFAASLKNIPALAVLMLITMVAATVATFTFGLGWLVLMPMLVIVMWLSYRDVFSV